MKKIFMVAALSIMLGTTNVQAQEFLGNNHVIKRVLGTEKYLLLPVEESEANAHIKVIKNNQVVQEFNCKLAVNKTDYLVPLDVQRFGNDVLLDIQFSGDRRTIGVMQDFACWKGMKTTNTFDTANREQYRPVYHHTPVYGWMNDPNGMFYKDGIWHLYFQYNPYGSQWENMTWGHSTSTDLIHWQQLPNAIEPDALGTIFSGNSVIDHNNTAGFGKDAIVAIYTTAGTSQTQSLAYSTDGGKTFVKYDKNPIITSDVPDFRDPKPFWNEDINKWNLVLAAGQELRFYSSNNLKEWTFESAFGEGYGNHGGVWECPDLLKMSNGKWILICNINPGGPFGGNATQYFTGSFDGHRFVCDTKPEVTKWLDYGKDHYATVSFSNTPDGRHVALPWMSNWQYANQVPTKQYRSANGIPRDLGVFSYQGQTYVSVKPSPEVYAAFSTETVSKLPSAAYLEVLNLKSNATITLSNDKGERVVMVYDAKKGTFSMDRNNSGKTDFSDDFKAVTIAPIFGAMRGLHIFLDKSSIEAFDIDGKTAMTNTVYPSVPYSKIAVTGCKIKIHPLR